MATTHIITYSHTLSLHDALPICLIEALADHDAEAQRLIASMLEHEYRDGLADIPGVPTLQRNAALILAGLLIASRVNPVLAAPMRNQPKRSLSDTSARCTSRSEEHTSELQSLMRTSYAVFCLKKNKDIPHEIYSY